MDSPENPGRFIDVSIEDVATEDEQATDSDEDGCR